MLQFIMKNKKVALIGLTVLGILILLVIVFKPQLPPFKDWGRIMPTPTSSQTPLMVTDDSGLFELKATYQGNATWKYIVTAQLPTPCDSAKVDVLVAESYPEQVTVRVVTSKSDQMCIQIIQDFSEEGTFSASEKAVIKLSVND